MNLENTDQILERKNNIALYTNFNLALLVVET